ncbi:autophagy-related protein 13-domain-containing protein [Favolaschia claudopus]|uniref:Autophagy-related protein 13 n=1 Tax=Favolaschia claudopus TaxID=2862362 RepID=A0AAW0ECR5_9AGAR
MSNARASPATAAAPQTETWTRTDQVTHHIYTKVYQIIYGARSTDQGPLSGRVDKWFNLETPLPVGNFPSIESDLEIYRSLSSHSEPRPLVIRILLAVLPGMGIIHTPSNVRIVPEARLILLEEWVLDFATFDQDSVPTSSSAFVTQSDQPTQLEESTPASLYKLAIPLLRGLYSLLRILPAWRTIRELVLGERMRVVLSLRPELEENPGERILGFGDSPVPDVDASPLPTGTHVFPSLPHPLGILTLSTTYLTTPFFVCVPAAGPPTLSSPSFAPLQINPHCYLTKVEVNLCCSLASYED